MKKKDKIVLGIGLFAMVLTIIIGTSFAYWKLSKVQEDQNIIATGCFNAEFTSGDGINLQSAYPISDEEGLQLTPYTFTIENKCDSYVSYQINLETLSQETGVKVLPDEYVRVDLQERTNSKVNSTLNSSIETETTLTEATKAYKLYTKYLKPNETKTYNLRIWMDKDTQPIEEVMNAFYSGKVTIKMSYINEKPKVEIEGTLRATSSSDTTAFYNYKSNITNIIIQDEINPIETELTWDVSEDNSGKVMSYLVPNEDDASKYTLYLQGDGGIYANPNSSYLFNSFNNLTTIEGLEYLDTSKVTDMSGMFSYCNSLLSLDLSNFDTSKVTDMSGMFTMYNSNDPTKSKLTEIKGLEIFNTSQVTNMISMFHGCDSLINLNLSSFDTSKVTNMIGMFGHCKNLVTLNLNDNFFNNAVIYGIFTECNYINTKITIRTNGTYLDALFSHSDNVAIASNAQITINYTAETSDLVDHMIATKSSNSNVVKGSLITE